MVYYSRKILNNSAIYGISNSLAVVFGFLLLPVYARFLTLQEYGIFATINITALILGIIYDMGLIGSLSRWYFDLSHSEESKRKVIVSSILLFYFLSALIPTLVLFCFSREISGLIFKGQRQYSDLIRLMVLTTYINLLAGVPITVLRLKEKAILYMVVSAFRGIGTALIILLYIVVFKEGLFGVFKANLIISLSIVATIFFLTYDNFLFKFSFSELTKMLAFGIVYLPTIIFMWAINFSDRYFLNYYTTLEDVGIYSFGDKIAQIIYIAVSAFSLAWTPILFSIIKETNGKEILSKMMTYLFFVLFSLALTVSMFCKEIVALVSVDAYMESYKIVPIIAFSYLLYGLYVFLFSGLLITKKINNQPLIIGASAVINIFLNMLFIPKYGYIGAAYATFFTYLAVVAGTYFMSQRCYYIAYENERLCKIAVVGGVIYSISFLEISVDLLSVKILWKVVLLAMFFYLLYLWKFFNLSEQNKIKVFFSRIFMPAS